MDTHGCEPVMLDLDKSPPKKRDRQTASSSATTEVVIDTASESTAESASEEVLEEDSDPTVWDKLSVLARKFDFISEDAKLFAAIYELFTDFGSVPSPFKPNEWPGRCDYDGHVFSISFPDGVVTRNEANEEKLPLKSFKISIVRNSVDTFLALKSVDTKKYCFHRISRLLIPSFKKEDKKRDSYKFMNLKMLLLEIHRKFVQPIPSKTILSISGQTSRASSASFTSFESRTSASNDSSSPA